MGLGKHCNVRFLGRSLKLLMLSSPKRASTGKQALMPALRSSVTVRQSRQSIRQNGYLITVATSWGLSLWSVKASRMGLPHLVFKSKQWLRGLSWRVWGHGCCCWLEGRNYANTPSIHAGRKNRCPPRRMTRQNPISQPQGCSASGRARTHLERHSGYTETLDTKNSEDP